MRRLLAVGVVVVVNLAWALPAQAQLLQLPADGRVAVCVEGVCAGDGLYTPAGWIGVGRTPHDLLEMTVGQTLPVLCAGQSETIYRVSDDVWVSTCPPERMDFGDGSRWGFRDTITPIVRVSAGGETLTLVYARREQAVAPCSHDNGSFVGLEHGSGSNPPKTGLWAIHTEHFSGGPWC